MTKRPDPRAALDEAALREVNEAIERGQWPGEEAVPAAFRCECSRGDCSQLVPITPREYERVRSNPRWFLVVPGHEDPDTESVVARAPGYLVVEKRAEAGRVAEATDPRS